MSNYDDNDGGCYSDGYANAGYEDRHPDDFDLKDEEGYDDDYDGGEDDYRGAEGQYGDGFEEENGCDEGLSQGDEDGHREGQVDNDNEGRIKAEHDDYIRGQVDDCVRGQLYPEDKGSEYTQSQRQDGSNGGDDAQERCDERSGYAQDREDFEQGDDDRYPQGDDVDQADDGRGHQDFEINDTMGGYNDYNEDVQYSPSEYQQGEVEEEYYRQGDDGCAEANTGPYEEDEVVGEGIKSYTVGVDEEYEAMEELFRQQPAEYGGGDTINDDDEDYSNTLYRPPRVRTQMRRDHEASMRRSRQQRGRGGPDAEERGHD